MTDWPEDRAKPATSNEERRREVAAMTEDEQRRAVFREIEDRAMRLMEEKGFSPDAVLDGLADALIRLSSRASGAEYTAHWLRARAAIIEADVEPQEP